MLLELRWISLTCKWTIDSLDFAGEWRMFLICRKFQINFCGFPFPPRELSRFIAAGKLHCKIDKVAGVLETNRPDAKNALYQATIKQGDLLLNRIQKLSRVIDLWNPISIGAWDSRSSCTRLPFPFSFNDIFRIWTFILEFVFSQEIIRFYWSTQRSIILSRASPWSVKIKDTRQATYSGCLFRWVPINQIIALGPAKSVLVENFSIEYWLKNDVGLSGFATYGHSSVGRWRKKYVPST